MKLLKYFIIACLTTSLSCSDFLDVSSELAGEISMEDVFSNPSYTRRFHRFIYTGIPDMKYIVYGSDYSEQTGLDTPWPALSDEIKGSRGSVNKIPTSGYHSGAAQFTRWTLYKQIRQCNIFLKHAKTIDGDVDKIEEAELYDMKATARFFKYYYHYLLFELYGPIPLMKEIAEPNASDLDFERASVDEVVDYLDKELLEVSKILPEQRLSDNERVMPTKGLALAVRAKLWVYAASPLLNGGYKEALDPKYSNNDGKRLFPDKDDSKPGKALAALKDVIDLAESGVYELHTVYNDDGTVNAAESLYQLQQKHSKEIIWAVTNNSFGTVSGDGHDRTMTPRTEGSGQTAIGVLQEMVDDFFMEDGLSIEESPLYKTEGFGPYRNEIPTTPIMSKVEPVITTEVSNMYLKREPRFYDAIMFQGRRWHISGRELFFHDGGNNGKTGGMCTKTGYLPYKGYCKELYNLGTFKKSQFRPSIIFRLGEFYLLYAEFLNEVSPADKKIIEYVDRVRVRAGITKLADIKSGIIGNKELQREAIRKEMRVELFMEGQRYFNVRRWMIAEEGQEAPQGGWVTGMDMDSRDPQEGFHEPKNLEFRLFERRMYLYPISLEEIQKSRKLVQNPGWE